MLCPLAVCACVLQCETFLAVFAHTVGVWIALVCVAVRFCACVQRVTLRVHARLSFKSWEICCATMETEEHKLKRKVAFTLQSVLGDDPFAADCPVPDDVAAALRWQKARSPEEVMKVPLLASVLEFSE